MTGLKAPFPWFGGKSRVAADVWARLGDTPNYVEPFFGSGAVLLGRPKDHAAKIETVNDLDGFVANFWRAVSRDPEETARWADWPVNENDKHARELHLIAQRERLTARLAGDPEFYDAKIAGWWAWGICLHIGGGFCSGTGPWVVSDGEMVDGRTLGNAGMGINRQMPHVGDAGRGINRQMPHVGDAGRGTFITEWFGRLSARLRHVRVLSGDWSRVLSESVTVRHGMTAVFLDPPYGEEVEQTRVYATDSGTVAADVRDWCMENGNNRLLRIALCGYEGEGHDALLDYGWTAHAWKTAGGYGGGRGGQGDENRHKERIYFSPACIDLSVPDLFSSLGEEIA
jgi:site-specific DNA-adenine methylase